LTLGCQFRHFLYTLFNMGTNRFVDLGDVDELDLGDVDDEFVE
jgi:hypothetical protein